MNWLALNHLTIVFFLFFSSSQSTTIVTVSAQNPRVSEISDLLEIPGIAFANESVKITSVVSEKIKKIFFEEGRFVKKRSIIDRVKR